MLAVESVGVVIIQVANVTTLIVAGSEIMSEKTITVVVTVNGVMINESTVNIAAVP